MPVRPSIAVVAGAALTTCLAVLAAQVSAPALRAAMERQAASAIARAGGAPIRAEFTGLAGLSSRNPVLSGGEQLDDATRERVARAVARVPGVGGVRWADGSIRATGGTLPLAPLHCQEDVNALLGARTIRFKEGSSAIDRGSRTLLDEVAAALRPCVGSVIAVTGHTDARGSEAANRVLSRQRADAVRAALIERGIPAEGLRARGLGSAQPVEGLLPEDPANRRIEFSVVATMPLKPSPVDTPSAR